MNYNKTTVEQLFQDIKDYVIAQRNLVLTVFAKKGADAVFVIILGTTFLLLGFFFTLFISFALAYALGSWIGYTSVGFLIVAFLYILIGLIIWMLKDRMIKIPLFKLFFNLLSPDKDQDYE